MAGEGNVVGGLEAFEEGGVPAPAALDEGRVERGDLGEIDRGGLLEQVCCSAAERESK